MLLLAHGPQQKPPYSLLIRNASPQGPIRTAESEATFQHTDELKKLFKAQALRLLLAMSYNMPRFHLPSAPRNGTVTPRVLLQAASITPYVYTHDVYTQKDFIPTILLPLTSLTTFPEGSSCPNSSSSEGPCPFPFLLNGCFKNILI